MEKKDGSIARCPDGCSPGADICGKPDLLEQDNSDA